MPALTIQISDKLKLFLNRYYTANRTLEENFYLALSENFIVYKGKSFCLSLEINEKFDRLRKEEIEAEIDFENNDQRLE